jgi:hypothetical protein
VLRYLRTILCRRSTITNHARYPDSASCRPQAKKVQKFKLYSPRRRHQPCFDSFLKSLYPSSCVGRLNHAATTTLPPCIRQGCIKNRSDFGGIALDCLKSPLQGTFECMFFTARVMIGAKRQTFGSELSICFLRKDFRVVVLQRNSIACVALSIFLVFPSCTYFTSLLRVLVLASYWRAALQDVINHEPNIGP